MPLLRYVQRIFPSLYCPIRVMQTLRHLLLVEKRSMKMGLLAGGAIKGTAFENAGERDERFLDEGGSLGSRRDGWGICNLMTRSRVGPAP